MTYEELKYRQGWTLEQKIDHAAGVVSSFSTRTNGNIHCFYLLIISTSVIITMQR